MNTFAATATPTADVDAVCWLLQTMGWTKQPYLLEVVGEAGKPVYAYRGFKVVVGPRWVTYYECWGGETHDMDSVPTKNLPLVEQTLREFVKPPSDVVKKGK